MLNSHTVAPYTSWSTSEDRLIADEYTKWPRRLSGSPEWGVQRHIAKLLGRSVYSVANRTATLKKSGKLKWEFTKVEPLQLTEPEKAWLAGVFDGEGSIHLESRPSTRHPCKFSYKIRVSLANTNFGILDELQRLVPMFKRSLMHRKGRIMAAGYATTKDCYQLWLCSVAGAKEFFRCIRPYMHDSNKCDKADQILSLKTINGTEHVF